jgi:vacuolar-type H+-ATPase subunit C/Vma6
VLETMRNASDIEAMDSALAAAHGGEFWRAGLQQWDGERPTASQRLWELAQLRWRLGLFANADPLGVGVLIAFVAARSAELRNLRLIAESVGGSVERDDARTHFLLAPGRHPGAE